MTQQQHFSQEEKTQIASKYASGQYTQQQLALAHFTSRTTIQRILKEMGREYKDSRRITVSPDEEQVLNLIRANSLTPRTLGSLMNQPPLTQKNVQLYLTQLPAEELAQLTYAVGLTRIANTARQHQAGLPDKAAANE